MASAIIVHVIREDPFNRDLLFAGTSISAYASLDRGRSWSRFAGNLPSVPVYDLKIHPRDRELIAATHGRGFWIANIAPLEQMTPKVVASEPYLFEPRTAYQWGEGPGVLASANGNAQAFFASPSPTYGAEISYRLPHGADTTPVRIQVWGASGDTLATLPGSGGAGIHSVFWNFQARPAPGPAAALTPSERRDSILKAVRGPLVLDSLKKAGYDTVALARARAAAQSADRWRTRWTWRRRRWWSRCAARQLRTTADAMGAVLRPARRRHRGRCPRRRCRR